LKIKFFPVILFISVFTSLYAQSEVITLDEAIEKAFSQNPQLMAGNYIVEASKERDKRSYAGYMPSLSFTTSYARQTGNPTSKPGVPITAGSSPDNTSYNYYSLGITLNQTIYDFGRTTGATEVSEAQLKSDIQDINVLKLSVWELVALRYSLVLTNQELLAVSKRNVESSQKHLEQSKALFENGLRPKLDMLRLEVELKNAEAVYISAASALKISKNDLLAALGIKDFFDFTAEKFDVSCSKPAFSGISSYSTDALDARPEMTAIKEKIKLSSMTLKTIKSDYFPILGFTATFSDAGTEISDLAWNWGIGIGISWPIFTGFSTYRSMKEAQNKLSALKFSQTTVEIQIKSEIMQAFENIEAADARIAAYEAAVKSSKEANNAAESRYESGSGTVIELLDASTALANSEANLVKAEFERALAYVRWQKALGKIPEKYSK